jgi:heterotetrameric sarcosine oxidase gamma subunit
MADRLVAESPLNGFRLEAKGAICHEDTGYAMVSVTAANGKIKALSSAITSAFGVALPGPGEAVTMTQNGKTSGKNKGDMILSSARDQVFICRQMTPEAHLAHVIKACGKVASVTDQSDAWARISLSGPSCPMIMERLCAVDTRLGAFPPWSVARTSIEHMGVIIIRQNASPAIKHHFVLLTPRSSAHDLAHALAETPPFKT